MVLNRFLFLPNFTTKLMPLKGDHVPLLFTLPAPAPSPAPSSRAAGGASLALGAGPEATGRRPGGPPSSRGPLGAPESVFPERRPRCPSEQARGPSVRAGTLRAHHPRRPSAEVQDRSAAARREFRPLATVGRVCQCACASCSSPRGRQLETLASFSKSNFQGKQ